MDDQETDFLEDTETETKPKKTIKRAKATTFSKYQSKSFRKEERDETNDRKG